MCRRLRIWGSEVRISSGAPFAYKTANLALASLATGDDGCQCSLVADDSNFVVVDFNLRDDRLEVGLSGLGIAGIELFSHELEERGEPIRVIIARVSAWTAIRSREACARSRCVLSASTRSFN
jgi:hypothetical protein